MKKCTVTGLELERLEKQIENFTVNPWEQEHEHQLLYAKYSKLIQMAKRNECMDHKNGIDIIRHEISKDH